MTTRAAKDGPRYRGLPSLNEARVERRRAIVLGRVRLKGMSHRFWIWALLFLGPMAVIYWHRAESELASGIGTVMAKQRAVAESLGPRIVPFRDNIEQWTAELAGPFKGDVLEGPRLLDAVDTNAGVYLRLSLKNAANSASIRRAASRSLRDGFTACMFRAGRAPEETTTTACQVSADCASGFLCSASQVCSRPSRPFNMRLAYRALRVLSTEWTDELHLADSKLAVTAFDRDLASVVKTDVPVAIELLLAAKFATIVLDEDPEGGLPEALPGLDETEEERLQRTEHWARIGTWDLTTNRLVWKVRRRAAGRFVPVGARAVRAEEAVVAQQRQANNCALALEVRQALEKRPTTETVPPTRAEAPAPASSADAQ